VRARLYFAHADQDRSMPAVAIARFEAALREHGGAFESKLYAGALHGWTIPDSRVHDRAAAERAHGKLLELLATLR
jgi:carboxymethylenebutenolidase